MKKILLKLKEIICSLIVRIKFALARNSYKEIVVTDKGEYLFRYCKDKVDGLDVYVEAYEKYINDFSEQFNISYSDSYKLLVNLYEVLKGEEITQFEFESEELKRGGN